MSASEDILLSLKPRHAGNIFSGEKSVELRRRRPNVANGTRVWIYATSPIAEIQGYATLFDVKAGSPNYIWKSLGSKTGISKSEFDSYFMDREVAYALILNDAMRMRKALGLNRIRELVDGFHPPQFYLHLNGAKSEMRLPQRKFDKVK